MSPKQPLLTLVTGALALTACTATLVHGATRLPARFGHSAVYDLAHDRLLVFGGNDGYDALLGDVWALPLAGHAGWAALHPAGALPPGRAYHTAVYDRARDRLVVFGGLGDTGPLDDVWALSLVGPTPEWTRLAPAGPGPTARYFHTAVLDATRDQVLVFGGLDDTGARRDLWALSLDDAPRWTLSAAVGAPPPARYQHSAIYDSELERMILFGGTDIMNVHGDAWSLTFANHRVPVWSRIVTSGPAPSARSGQAAVYDPVGRRMVLFGGWDMASGPLEDIWTLSLGASPAWSAVPCDGVEPCARTIASGTLDLPRNRLIVFGGTGSGDRYSLDDAWALPLPFSPAWRELAPVLDAPPGGAPAAVSLAAGPNPCRGTLEIRYTVPRTGRVELSVLDLGGRLVQRLVAGERPGGPGAALWDARRAGGSSAEPGVYFVRLAGEGFTRTQRVVLVR